MPIGDELAEHKAAIKAELVRYDQSVIELEAELDEFLKILAWQREALKNETIVMGGVAGKNGGVSKEAIVKSKDLAAAYESAGRAQERLLKTRKLRQDGLKPEQRSMLLARAILAMPYPERREFITSLLGQHNARRKAALEAGLEKPTHDQPTEGPVVSFLEIV